LRFGAVAGRDDPAELLAIPDPVRVEAVNVQAVADRAVAWPVAGGAIGTVAVWNLTTGLLEHDLTLPAAPRQVALDATGTRVLAATDRVALLWSVADGVLVGRAATQTEFVLPPVFSADGGYVAIAERVDGANPLYSVLRSADASLVTTVEGATEASGWELGPGGRYVVLQGPATLLRVIETRRGTEIGRLAHAQSVERLLHSADGTALVTVDGAGFMTAWPLTSARTEPGRPLGRTSSASSVSASADGRRLAYTRDDGAVSVLDVAARAELYRLRLPPSMPTTSTQLSANGLALVTQSGALFKLWALPGGTAAAQSSIVADAVASALAIDRTSDLVAIGLVSGQLRLVPLSSDAPATEPLAFFGHRGRITAAALRGSSGLAATGGSDGVVRIWDIASGAPTGAIMQATDAAIVSVALSADGRHVASVAGRTLRIATVADGRVIRELNAASSVTAIAFAPDGASIAVGERDGRVVVAALDSSRERASARLEAAATSLAFTPDGSRLAAGDAGGAITLIDTALGTTEGSVRRWSQPVRWLEFSADGSTLLAATDSWLHSLATETAALAPLHSELVVWPSSGAVRTPLSATTVAVAGIAVDGSVVSATLDLAAADDSLADAAPLVARDWTGVFALRLNDNGEPVPFEP
jgi:WD40 repeat protein